MTKWRELPQDPAAAAMEEAALVRSRTRLLPGDLWRGTRLVAGRELGAYFDSPIAYVYVIAFAILANAIFMNDFFLAGRVEMRAYFERMPLLLSVFLPAVTMRLWAEERKQRTIELLLTLPIVPAQAILGKYLAALVLLLLFLATSLPIVVMLGVLGAPDYGLIAAGYLGVIGLGSVLLALGAFLSSLSGDQIIAFVTTTVLSFVLVLLGHDRVVSVLDGLLPGLGAGTFLRESISVMPHHEAFVAGTVELSALVYFAGMSAVLLWLNSVVLARHRA